MPRKKSQMLELVTADPWRPITAMARKAARQSQVAVAYFGSAGSSMLPLQRGSTLVVDMSPNTVKRGLTKPSEVLKLIRRGVDVHSVENLHAKVFVFGNWVVLGSTNVSGNSARLLLEAAVSTADPQLVKSCKAFVLGLRGELVTPEQAKKLQKLYRPPKFGLRPIAGVKPPKSEPRHAPLWIVPLSHIPWDPEDTQAEADGMAAARRKLGSKRAFKIEDFVWIGVGFIDRLRQYDLIVQATDVGRKQIMVSPACRVLSIKRYKKGRGHRAIVYLESATRFRRKDLNSIIRALGPAARSIGKLKGAKTIRDWSFAHALLNLWPKTGSPK